jgi:hypothetical protein
VGIVGFTLIDNRIQNMKDNTAIHPLARPGEKSGKIRFIHADDGLEHSFSTCVNDMTGDRMSSFDECPPHINDSLSWVRSVFRDIRKRSTKVLEVIGDF